MTQPPLSLKATLSTPDRTPVPTPLPDPALPHLPAAFDGRRLTAAIVSGWEAAVSGGTIVESFEPEWIRYKPGASCIVRGALHTRSELAAVGSATITLYADGREAIVARPGGRLTRLADRAALLHGDAVPRFAHLESIEAILQIAPVDRKLPRLVKAASPARIARVLGLDPSRAENLEVDLIRHVPERKAVFVLRLESDSGRRTLYAKLHGGRDAERLGRQQAALAECGLPVGALVCADARLGLTIVEAVPGRTLRELRDDPTVELGAALAAAVAAFECLHTLPTNSGIGPGLARRTGQDEALMVLRAARYIDVLLPPSARRAGPPAERIAAALADIPWHPRLVHGDAYDRQVLVEDGVAHLIDFDDLAIGDPALDHGTFVAHFSAWAAETALLADRTEAARARDLSATARAAVLDAACMTDSDAARRIALLESAALMRLAIHPFRRLDQGWPAAVEAIVAEAAARFAAFERPRRFSPRLKSVHSLISAEQDPSDRTRKADLVCPSDPLLPTLPLAIDPQHITAGLRGLGHRDARITTARVVRHKVGRRCLVEYRTLAADSQDDGRLRAGCSLDDLSSDAGWTLDNVQIQVQGGTPPLLFGKLYASHRGPRVFAAHAELYAAQRAAARPGAPRLPEPVGYLEAARVVLLGAVPGEPVTERLCVGDVVLASRIGLALGALHSETASLPRRHSPADELAPLAQRIARLRTADKRLERAAHAAFERLEFCAPQAGDWRFQPLHRDLHPEQILATEDGGIGFVDLDDAALGEPAIDVGNFIAHLRMLAVRRPDRIAALRAAARAFRRAHRSVDRGIDPAVVAWCEAAALLRLADVHLESGGIALATALVRAGAARLSSPN